MNDPDRTRSAGAVDAGGAPVGTGGDFPTEWCGTGRPPESSPTAAPLPPRADVWIEHLGVEECWALLSQTPVGRIGVLVDSAPEIYPVNHLVDQATIVFRTDPGGKLRGLDRSPSVSYEVDGTDSEAETGWSVLVKGRAAEVHATPELRRLAALPLRPWAGAVKSRWIRIEPVEVTGRRIHRVSTAAR